MTKTELNLYCNLLSVAYELYKDKTNGLVCGSEAEKLRDEMFVAIKEAGIIGESKVDLIGGFIYGKN